MINIKDVEIVELKDINDKDIDRVERILLPPHERFDEERRRVIKYLETKDIKACPGSGKTTALIAKLFLLAERMPFKDGRGICVLTHTNVAIDEIRKRLGSKCDELFKYPNHFGTIQSFVDKFLAIPGYMQITGKRPVWIDNDLYEYRANKFNYENLKDFPKEVSNNAKKWIHQNGISNIRISYYNKNKLINLKTGKEILSDANHQSIFKWIKKFKNKILEYYGIITFEEAYMLANRYLSMNPNLKYSFSWRFKYVFIDEMQDTRSHQNRLINEVFDKSVVIQKIGDPYQAIYDESETEDCVWGTEDPLEISNSRRFGHEIAGRLRTICIENYKKLSGNEAVESVPPHLILFDDNTIGNVLKHFAKLIHENDLNKVKAGDIKRPFKAVGWVGKRKEKKDQLTLNSYFTYNADSSYKGKKNHFKKMSSYLRKQPAEIIEKNGAKVYREAVLNVFVRILDISGKKNQIGNKNIAFTLISMVKYLIDNHEEKYFEFIQKVAIWILDIHNSNDNSSLEKTWKSVLDYVKDIFIHFWEITLSKDLEEFIELDEPQITENYFNTCNVYVDKSTNIEIEVGTIHSVKGETHKATLYLETFYYGHDLKKIINFIQGKYDEKLRDKYKNISRALKMAYVGMSRPTHLLCLGMQKKDVTEHIKELDIKKNLNGWIIEDLTK